MRNSDWLEIDLCLIVQTCDRTQLLCRAMVFFRFNYCPWSTKNGPHLEDVGVASQRLNTLLDASSPGVVQAYDRRPHQHCLVHDLTDLLSMRTGEGATVHSEILRENTQSTVWGNITF